MKPSHKLSVEQKADAVERYRRGESPKQIGEALGVTGPAISYLVRKHGVTRSIRPGVYPGHKRYDKPTRRHIARLWAEGVCTRDLCAEWGIGDSTLYKYAREFDLKPPPRPDGKDSQYVSLYGITRADRDELFSRQGGKCAICGCPPGKYRLCVDHCHKTDVVRGLLCRRCNLGIGYFKDNPGYLRAAYFYLKRFSYPPA